MTKLTVSLPEERRRGSAPRGRRAQASTRLCVHRRSAPGRREAVAQAPRRGLRGARRRLVRVRAAATITDEEARERVDDWIRRGGRGRMASFTLRRRCPDRGTDRRDPALLGPCGTRPVRNGEASRSASAAPVLAQAWRGPRVRQPRPRLLTVCEVDPHRLETLEPGLALAAGILLPAATPATLVDAIGRRRAPCAHRGAAIITTDPARPPPPRPDSAPRSCESPLLDLNDL